jgi:cytochrome c2
MLGLVACESDKPISKAHIFSIENLPKTTFQFSNKKDTILIGKAGTIFHIPANAFVDKNDKTYKGEVKIELLEAFTLKDMILGNLTTVSDDGRLLESSGMFRLSIKGNGKTLKVNPATKVMMTIPAINTQDDSQIFYGNLDDQGDLTWSLADLTNIESSNKRLLLGRNLLLRECASCHNINLIDDMTGPALAWVAKRWNSKADLMAFTRNSEAFGQSGNLRAKAMLDWAPSSMTAFEYLSEEELNAIYYYIDETARVRKIDSTSQKTLSDASYQAYFKTQDSIRKVYTSIQRLEDSIRNTRYQTVVREGSNLLYQVSSTLNKSVNWVNIDRFMSVDGSKQKDLRVNIKTKKIDFYLKEVKIILPNRNSMILAYLNRKEGYYSFTERYQLESTPFPIGEKAYLMATANTIDGIYFALKSITIGEKDVEELDLKLISKEDLIQKIKTTF